MLLVQNTDSPFCPSISGGAGGKRRHSTSESSNDPDVIEQQIAKKMKSGGAVAELQNFYYIETSIAQYWRCNFDIDGQLRCCCNHSMVKNELFYITQCRVC